MRWDETTPDYILLAPVPLMTYYIPIYNNYRGKNTVTVEHFCHIISKATSKRRKSSPHWAHVKKTKYNNSRKLWLILMFHLLCGSIISSILLIRSKKINCWAKTSPNPFYFVFLALCFTPCGQPFSPCFVLNKTLLPIWRIPWVSRQAIPEMSLNMVFSDSM